MATKAKTVATQGAKPVKLFRARGVKVAIFANQTMNGDQEITFHKLSLQRIYKEGEEWRSTNSLSRDDVPVARLLLGQAWGWIIETEANRNKEKDEE